MLVYVTSDVYYSWCMRECVYIAFVHFKYSISSFYLFKFNGLCCLFF